MRKNNPDFYSLKYQKCCGVFLEKFTYLCIPILIIPVGVIVLAFCATVLIIKIELQTNLFDERYVVWPKNLRQFET